ncbi:MAG: EpsD family peptidyl-prolyl cis-trans isomerase [Pseudomonadota bacterium]
MNKLHSIRLSAGALALAIILAGCGGKDEEKKATQVAAQVNGEEITVHQINFALQRLGKVEPEQAKQAGVQALKSLVDKQLLVQQALEDKLDRDPQVSQALEEGRRQILATAYIERLTANVTPPTDAEIQEYHDKNPALFSQRRIYKLQELVLRPPAEKVDALKTKLGEIKNLNELVEWLKAEQIPARAAQSVKPAEQLPLELLPRLQNLNPGQSITLAGNGQFTILSVVDVQVQPIGMEQAKPLIERYLTGNRKREMADAKLQELKKKAQIEYKGDYTDLNQAADTAAPAPAPAAAPATPAAPATADQSAMDKGLQGLK